MKNPTYTIVIPVYERIFGFNEALNSALEVNGCNEIIVLDNCSSHGKFKSICEEKKSKKLKYYRNESNLGLFGNWNKAAEVASSDYFSILCSDDIINKNTYKYFKEAYEKHNDVDLFFGSFTTFKNDISDAKTIKKFKPGLITGEFLIKEAIDNGLGFPVLMILRKKIALEIPYISQPHSGNDWLWIYSHATKFKLFAFDKPLNYWRRHDDQDASKSQNITTDCWPLMFMNMKEQLKNIDPISAKKAENKAKGVILSWLLNDYKNKNSYYKRLKKDEEVSNNIFLLKSIEIINNNFILRNLLYNSKFSSIFYFIGRILRKTNYYKSA